MSAPASPEFTKAQEDVKALTQKPSNDELLRIYALFKIGSGFKVSEAPAPGMFDLKGKAKYNAWKAAEDEGITDPADAQAKYVAYVEELKTKYA